LTSTRCRAVAFQGALVASLVAASLATPAAAQPLPAERIFREGREAVARGDIETGCAKFAESVALVRAPGPMLNLADCEERKGRLVSAARLWKEGVDLLEPRDPRRAPAQERAVALDKRLPRIRVIVTPVVDGAEIAIDGTALPPAEASAPHPVDPGDHEVSAKAGDRSGRVKVSIAEGERKDVSVPLAPAQGPTAPAPATKATTSPPPALRTAGFVAGGVGLLGLGAFGVTAVLIQGQRAVLKDECNAQKQCTPEGLQAVESGKVLTPINTAALIVGAVGVTAGITLILVSPSPKDATKPTVALRPGPLSASLVGTF
jgi:hypothetical protein